MILLILTVSLVLVKGGVLQGDIIEHLRPPPAVQEVPKKVSGYATIASLEASAFADQDVASVGVQEQRQHLLHQQIQQEPQIEPTQQQQYTGVIQRVQGVQSDQGLLASYQPSIHQIAQIPLYKNSVLSGQGAQYQSTSLTTGAKFELPAVALTNDPPVPSASSETSSGTGHRYTTVTFGNGLVGLGHTVDYNAISQSQNQNDNLNYYSSSQGSQEIAQNVGFEHQQAVFPSHGYSAPETNALGSAQAYDTISISENIPTIPIEVPQTQAYHQITKVFSPLPTKVPTQVEHYSQPLPVPMEVKHVNFERPAPQHVKAPVVPESPTVKVPEYQHHHDFHHQYRQPLHHHNHHSIDLSKYNHLNLYHQELPHSSAHFNFHKDFHGLNLQSNKNYNFKEFHGGKEISTPSIYPESSKDFHGYKETHTLKDFHTPKNTFKPISQSIHSNHYSHDFHHDGLYEIPHYHGSNHHSSSILSGLTGGLSSKLYGGYDGSISLHSGNSYRGASSYGGDYKFAHGLGNTHTSVKHGYHTHTSDLDGYKLGHGFSSSLGFSTPHSQHGSGRYASGYSGKYLGMSADYGKHSFSLPSFEKYADSLSTDEYHKVPDTIVQQYDSKGGYKY